MVGEVGVAAVVCGPDRARHGSHRSGRPVALVLGAGGVLGAAWMTGALACAAVLTPHRVPPWVAASAWLPHGRGPHTALRPPIPPLQHPAGPSRWVAPPTWVAALD